MILTKLNMKSKTCFHIALHGSVVLSMFFFAGYTCIGRHLQTNSPLFEPLIFLLNRHCWSALILLLYCLVKYGRIQLPNKQDYCRVFACGSLGISAMGLLYLYGLRATTATNAACITPFAPCLTFVMAVLFKYEALECTTFFLLRVIGVVLGCCGALVTTFGHDREEIRVTGVGKELRLSHLPTFVGDISIILSCLMIAIYLLISKELVQKYEPLWLTAWVMLTGAMFTLSVTFLSLLAAGGSWYGWSKWHVDTTFVFEEIYAIFFATVLAYLLRFWAIKYLNATTVAMYYCLDPPATASVAAIFLGESIHFNQVVGSLLILIGMSLTIYFGEKKKMDTEERGIEFQERGRERAEKTQGNGHTYYFDTSDEKVDPPPQLDRDWDSQTQNETP